MSIVTAPPSHNHADELEPVPLTVTDGGFKFTRSMVIAFEAEETHPEASSAFVEYMPELVAV